MGERHPPVRDSISKSQQLMATVDFSTQSCSRRAHCGRYEILQISLCRLRGPWECFSVINLDVFRCVCQQFSELCCRSKIECLWPNPTPSSKHWVRDKMYFRAPVRRRQPVFIWKIYLFVHESALTRRRLTTGVKQMFCRCSTYKRMWDI